MAGRSCGSVSPVPVEACVVIARVMRGRQVSPGGCAVFQFTDDVACERPGAMHRRVQMLTIVICGTASALSAADVFDRHTSFWLKRAIADAQPLTRFSATDSVKIKSLSANLSGTGIVVKTDEDRLAKVLITWGFRRGSEAPIPVVMLERFVTYRKESDITTARGQTVMLFPGFQFNLDIGQVVPQGQGGDLQVTDDGALMSIGAAKLFALNGTQLPQSPATKGQDPNDHDGVLTRDFSGRWSVNTDGRWRGELKIEVDDRGRATGRFVSRKSRSAYPVSGRVVGKTHRVKLTIQLESAAQTLDLWLWTGDKSAMAGTGEVGGRTFGAYAVRLRNE